MKCSECGFRIRGKGHNRGAHHVIGRSRDKDGHRIPVNPKGFRPMK